MAVVASLLPDHDQMKGIITMKRIALIATLVLVSVTPAFAHAGHGIASGFLHPFLGWDHLIAMLAVGAWGATLGLRAIWHSWQTGERLNVQVTSGVHHIVIQKSGYRTFTNDITVQAGASTPLNVSLSAQ